MAQDTSLATLLQRPGLARGERLLVRAQALIWPGRWPELSECFRQARAQGVPRVQVEELLLQAILFCGFPRIIHAFRSLQDAWPVEAAPTGGGLPQEQWASAGRELFQAIYGDNTAGVREMLRSYHGELHDFVLDAAYGRVLSRPGLDPRVRELAAVAALATMDQVPQLVAHGRGAMRFGADAEQVGEALFTALLDEAATAALLRKVRGNQ